MTTFGTRLRRVICESGPLCVGIDPSADLLDRWGLPDSAEGVREFCSTVLAAVEGVAGVVKPQVAFFERHGSAGFAVLEQVISAARGSGLIVIADAKRGDIGSTAAAYASAWLDPASPMCVDAVTATAYLGLDALSPMFNLAGKHGNGVIVVARSSNPEGSSVQGARVAPGRTVADEMLRAISDLNAAETGGSHPGSVGAVIGATTRQQKFDYAQLGGSILAPGLGAQGATPADFRSVFNGCPEGTVVGSVSRAVLEAGPRPADLRIAAKDWQEQLRGAS